MKRSRRINKGIYIKTTKCLYLKVKIELMTLSNLVILHKGFIRSNIDYRIIEHWLVVVANHPLMV